jgi:hypothetical protein
MADPASEIGRLCGSLKTCLEQGNVAEFRRIVRTCATAIPISIGPWPPSWELQCNGIFHRLFRSGCADWADATLDLVEWTSELPVVAHPSGCWPVPAQFVEGLSFGQGVRLMLWLIPRLKSERGDGEGAGQAALLAWFARKFSRTHQAIVLKILSALPSCAWWHKLVSCYACGPDPAADLLIDLAPALTREYLRRCDPPADWTSGLCAIALGRRPWDARTWMDQDIRCLAPLIEHWRARATAKDVHQQLHMQALSACLWHLVARSH